MRELSLHILDIAANSVAAGASQVSIRINEDTNEDKLIISIKDNGKGMDQNLIAKVSDPFVTSRTERRVGLGIPLFKAAAEACNGNFLIDSELGVGTHVFASFQNSHIDRMPLGNIIDTFLTLLLGTPEINWILSYKFNEKEFYFDDTLIKNEIQGISITEPEVIRFMKTFLQEGISEVKQI